MRAHEAKKSPATAGHWTRNGRARLGAAVFLFLGALSLTAWGEGVDIFPIAGSGGRGGTGLGDDDPGGRLSAAVVYRQDGGSVEVRATRQSAPGLILEDIDSRHVFEGRADDGDTGPLPLAFELELIDPDWAVSIAPGGLKNSGVMRATDLDPDDGQELFLEGGAQGRGVMLVFLGHSSPAGEDPDRSSIGSLREFSGMAHVATVELASARVDLGRFRANARELLGGRGLDVGLVVIDHRGQWSSARFSVDSDRAAFSVTALD